MNETDTLFHTNVYPVDYAGHSFQVTIHQAGSCPSVTVTCHGKRQEFTGTALAYVDANGRFDVDLEHCAELAAREWGWIV